VGLSRRRPRNSEHKENFDLAHDVCQALTGDKLHKTNIKDNADLTRTPTPVKGIGPEMSEVSDVKTVPVSLFGWVD